MSKKPDELPEDNMADNQSASNEIVPRKNHLPDEVKSKGQVAKETAGAAASGAHAAYQKSGNAAVGALKSGAKSITVNSKAGNAAIEAADKARKTADAVNKTQKAVSTVGKLVPKDPTSWIVIALIVVGALLFTYVYSASQVIGRNENADGCMGDGASSSFTLSPIKMDGHIANKESAWGVIGGWLMSHNFKFLGNKPMTKDQAAGVIGNMMRESGLTPSMSQGGFSPGGGWADPKMTNEQILAMGNAGGRGLGIIQWDGSRRADLAKFAIKKGTHWSDPVTQLEFMEQELNGGEGNNLKSKFGQEGINYTDATIDWEDKYERAGVPAIEERIKNAKDFYDNFQGGSGDVASSGGSCLMDGGFDASSVVALAISISYQPEDYGKSKVSGGDADGCNNATPAYKAAKKVAEEKGGKDTFSYGCGDLYASCDRFVATVIKQTQDPDLPWGPTQTQYAYLKNSPKWQEYTSKSEANPGDIWVTRGNGHIVLYIGNYKGKDSIASASNQSRVAAIGGAAEYSESLVDGSSRQYSGFRYVGG